MFLSSFAPLFALLAFENRSTSTIWLTLVAMAVIGVIGLIVVIWFLKSEVGPGINVLRSTPKDGEVLSYIAAYLIPFLAVDLTKLNGVVTSVGFLAVLCVVYINSNMLFVNPLLSLVGFHTLEVTDIDENVYTLISRRKGLDPGVTIRPAQIDQYLRVEVHASTTEDQIDDSDRESR